MKTTPNKITPGALAPDFDNLPGEIIATEKTFWLGVTDDCPRGQIDIAGLHFPKMEEDIRVDKRTGKQTRVAVQGTINATVTKLHFDALVDLLPRLVIRQGRNAPERTGGEDIGDPIQQAKGRIVKIPDAKMMVGAEGPGRRLAPYVKQPGDRPATEFMFFIHAPDGHRGHSPKTISETGIEWPEDVVPVKKEANKKPAAEPATA